MTDANGKLPQGRLSRFARLAATGVRTGRGAPLRPRPGPAPRSGRPKRSGPLSRRSRRRSGRWRATWTASSPTSTAPRTRRRSPRAALPGAHVVGVADPGGGRGEDLRRPDRGALRGMGRDPGRERLDRPGAPRAPRRRARGRGQGAASGHPARGRERPRQRVDPGDPRLRRRRAEGIPGREGRPRRHQAALPRGARLRARGGQRITYFANVHAGDPTIRIPTLVATASEQARALTCTAFVRGGTFEDACAASEDERRAWAETMWRFVFKGNLVGGQFNADPHPGNYIFHEGGAVTFLDYGCVQPDRPRAPALGAPPPSLGGRARPRPSAPRGARNDQLEAGAARDDGGRLRTANNFIPLFDSPCTE